MCVLFKWDVAVAQPLKTLPMQLYSEKIIFREIKYFIDEIIPPRLLQSLCYGQPGSDFPAQTSRTARLRLPLFATV